MAAKLPVSTFYLGVEDTSDSEDNNHNQIDTEISPFTDTLNVAGGAKKEKSPNRASTPVGKIKPTNANTKKIIKKLLTKSDIWRINDFLKTQIKTLDTENAELKSALHGHKLDHWKFSAINRFHSMAAMAYRIMPDTTDTIVVLYKIKDVQQTEKEVTYTMAYIEQKPTGNVGTYMDTLERIHDLELGMSDNIYITSICPSGSMVSKDGEYRSGMLNWNSLQVAIRKAPEVNRAFKAINDYFINVLKERKYVLLTEYYFPTDRLKNRFQYETELLCSTTKVSFFCIVWYNFFYGYYFGFVSNHVNDIFKSLMLRYKKEDIEFFKSLWKKFSYGTLESLRYICGNYLKGYSTDLRTYNKSKIGQKIIPLNLIEAQNFFNIEYAPWKEFAINLKASNLVVNNITNGFNLSNSWFVIKNPDRFFYDNPSQADRMAKSGIALKIAELLTQAKLYTYSNINVNPDNDIENDIFESMIVNVSQKHGDITTWLSNEFKVLYNKIQGSIDHTKENIIMSNVSLCLITEFVGKTLYDAIFMAKQSSYYNHFVPSIFAEENHRHFRKYMFQICYNLYCLNDKLQIIHGDLHLNNITLNTLFYKKGIVFPVDAPKILYSIDKRYQYIFENNFYDICIIDFSRAIMSTNYEDFAIDGIPFEPIHTKTQFLTKQVHALLSYLYSTKPEFRELGTSLETAMMHHYSEYFKVLTVLDIYNLTSKFIDFLKVGSSYIKHPYKESVRLINDLNKSAEYYLTIVLNKLISQRSYEEIQQMEWPVLSIIKDVFSDDHVENFGRKEFESIVDVYRFDNDHNEYSISMLKKFPPMLRQPDMFVDDEKKNIIDQHDTTIKRRKQYETKMLKNNQVLLTIAKRQREKHP
jgi:hypothetical protein